MVYVHDSFLRIDVDSWPYAVLPNLDGNDQSSYFIITETGISFHAGYMFEFKNVNATPFRIWFKHGIFS